MLRKNLVLNGFRGCGKTIIGGELSKKFGVEFIDIDEKIKNTFKTEISEIINKENDWEIFRLAEQQILDNILDTNNIKIISLGGGLLNHKYKSIRKQNLQMIEEKNFYIISILPYFNDLKKSAEIITQRILKDKKNDNQRPEFENTNLEILKKRIKYYKNCDLKIETKDMEIDEVVNLIVNIIMRNKDLFY